MNNILDEIIDNGIPLSLNKELEKSAFHVMTSGVPLYQLNFTDVEILKLDNIILCETEEQKLKQAEAIFSNVKIQLENKEEPVKEEQIYL